MRQLFNILFPFPPPHYIYSTQTLLTALALHSLLFIVAAALPPHKGIYDSTELTSSEMQSKRRVFQNNYPPNMGTNL